MSDTPLYPYRGPLITSGIGDLCDGPFRRERGAFRVDIGNEGWNFVVGGDPNTTTLDFINGMNQTKVNGTRAEALLGKSADGKVEQAIYASIPLRLPGRAEPRTRQPGYAVRGLHRRSRSSAPENLL